MRSYLEEYGLMIIVTIIILSLITMAGALNTQVKNHVNDRLHTSLAESEITQLDPDNEATSGSGGGSLVIDIGNAVGILPIEKGGLNATTIKKGKENLGLSEVAEMDIVPIANGGTGRTTASAATTALGAIKDSEVLNATYPVGSIYLSAGSENPANLFGGTWKKLQNRFLLAAGSNYTAGSTGGLKNAALVTHSHSFTATAASSGSHSHTFQYENNGSSSSTYRPYRRTSKANYGIGYMTSAGAHTHTVSGNTATEGESATNKNMPPYLVVYMWERTA